MCIGLSAAYGNNIESKKELQQKLFFYLDVLLIQKHIVMENPFEIINNRLERIESLLETLVKTSSSSKDGVYFKRIMNCDEVAAYLDLSKSAVYKLSSDNEIPRIKRRKRLYFDREAIDKWLLEGKQLDNSEIERMAADYLIKHPFKGF